jgi:ABC-type transport system involved in multi-copper enzyme maturation permease subunit
MFRLIIVKELKEVLSSTKFSWTFCVASGLILLSFFLGAKNFATLQAQHDAAVAQSYRRLEGLSTWVMARPMISLPPDPVACLVQGVSNDIGRNIEVSGRGALRAADSRYGEEPLLATFRLLDLEFIFGVVLSLFAVVFAFDGISGEKQRGTLRLVFSNAIGRHVFILGKMVGTFLGLTVPLLIPILLGCLMLVVLGVPMVLEHWLRLVLVIGVGFLYVGAFIGLATLVSALTKQPTTSMLVLLVVWVFGVLVLPRACMLIAARSIEAPSLDEILSQRSRLRTQLWHEDEQKMNDFWESADSQLGGEPDDMQATIGRFNAFMQKLASERQERLDTLERRLMEDRSNRQALQRRLGFGLARISPAASFTLASTRLAGTSLGLQAHYQEQATEYQRAFLDFQREKTGGQASGEIMVMISAVRSDEEPEAIDPHELPPFVYTTPELSDSVRASLGDIGLLAFFNLLFFASAFTAFLKYDVR